MSVRVQGVRAGTLSRRRVLAACAGAAALPAVLGACTSSGDPEYDDPAVLLGLADQARADAALVVSAVTAAPDLAGRLEPLRAARMAHATALDAAGGRTTPPPVSPADPNPANAPDIARVRDAVSASARAAAELVARAAPTRVGLVAEVAACCAAYSTVLT